MKEGELDGCKEKMWKEINKNKEEGNEEKNHQEKINKKEKEEVVRIVKRLESAIRYKLNLGDPYRVLITTVISQRTRDENTRVASERLFSKFKDVKEIAKARTKDIERLIKPSGFYKEKARRIKEISRIILERYEGRVPRDINELLKLPGVGRKTANCVVVYGFGGDAIPVDTHVHRISNRLGLVKTRTPEETEKGLMKILPKNLWKKFNILFVRFGQTICRPINPKCEECPVKDMCDYGRKRRVLSGNIS